MTDWLSLGVSLAAGLALGVLHFAGLWVTVRRMPTFRWPVLLTFGSFLARTAVTLSGFFLVARTDWRQLPVCVAVFLLARVAVLRQLRPGGTPI